MNEDNLFPGVEGNHREVEPVSLRNVQLHQPARFKASFAIGVTIRGIYKVLVWKHE